MVLSICRVMVRQAARMAAGRRSRARSGIQHVFVDAAVDEGEGESPSAVSR